MLSHTARAACVGAKAAGVCSPARSSGQQRPGYAGARVGWDHQVRIQSTPQRWSKAWTVATRAKEPTAPEHWSAKSYEKNARFVADYGRDVLEVLAPKEGEKILDLGCGDGALTEELQRRGVSVVGVDSSADMIQAAAARGVDALVCDGHRLSFDQEFDAVFSNAALHWMKEDPAAVIGGAKAALKPGGRFVGELGGHGNIASIVVALSAALTFHGVELAGRHPWFFPSAEEYRTLLEAAGFEVHSMELFRRPTELPTGISGWLATFSGPWMNGLEEDKRVAVLSMAQELLEPVLKRRDDGVWVADYVRLRFSARLPAPSDT
mmetsp:Transcript_444/g.1339  ORF Transcript_444/g.1339 Transcript_444/m.1339 type:complete len:322 (+) Transcript_444:365-1330(+)